MSRKGFYFFIFFLLTAYCLLPTFLFAARLIWDANTEADLAGYKVHRGQGSGSYDYVLDVGNVTEYEIESLNSGTYFYAVTAYNLSGDESGFSNEVMHVVDSGPQEIAAATDVQIQYQEQVSMALEYKGITTVIQSREDISQNIAIPEGSTLAIICVGGFPATGGTAAMISSASIDSQSTVMAVKNTNPSYEMCEIWYVRGFGTGSKNLTIDFRESSAPNGEGYNIYVVFFSGEDPDIPISDTDTDVIGNLSITLTTIAGDIGLILVSDYKNDPDVDQNGQTEIADSEPFIDSYADIGYKAATGSSLTLIATSGASYGVGCAITIKAAAAAGAASIPLDIIKSEKSFSHLLVR